MSTRREFFDFLSNPVFRRVLTLVLEGTQPDKEEFLRRIGTMGSGFEDYSNILYEVAIKEHEMLEHP